MKIPKEIQNLINGQKMKEIVDFHRSGDGVFLISKKFVLKVSINIERLEKEYKKDEWFCNILPTPKPIVFLIENETAYYLKTYIDGDMLCDEKYLKQPKLLMKLLKEALDLFHSKAIGDCPFVVGDGESLIHGDFCLPNILAKDNKIVGFIDLGDAGIGDIRCDYAWCIWSFEYNLNTKKYTDEFLKNLNIDFTLENLDKYLKE